MHWNMYLCVCVSSQDLVHLVLYSVTITIVTSKSRYVILLMIVEMELMSWIVGHPAHLNMGAVVGKTARRTPSVGPLESAPFI